MGFSLSSLRGAVQPELSRRLYKLIKTINSLVSAHEAAGRERVAIATQLSEWGEQTGDEAISDVSDKVGVIMSEMGEQEDVYAHSLDDARAVLKQVRNTEKSVQPTRDGKRKIADEIAKLKSKEPESTKLVTLEQELVRAEAENLVAEAQLTNIVSPVLSFSGTKGVLVPDEADPVICGVALTSISRLVKNSRKLMTPSSSPPSSVPRSRSSSPATAAASCTSSTTTLLCQVRSAGRISTARRPGRS